MGSIDLLQRSERPVARILLPGRQSPEGRRDDARSIHRAARRIGSWQGSQRRYRGGKSRSRQALGSNFRATVDASAVRSTVIWAGADVSFRPTLLNRAPRVAARRRQFPSQSTDLVPLWIGAPNERSYA